MCETNKRELEKEERLGDMRIVRERYHETEIKKDYTENQKIQRKTQRKVIELCGKNRIGEVVGKRRMCL